MFKPRVLGTHPCVCIAQKSASIGLRLVCRQQIQYSAICKSIQAYIFCCGCLCFLCMCTQVQSQLRKNRQCRPSLFSSVQIHEELTKDTQACLLSQISILSIWLVFWFTGCPKSESNLNLAKPEVFPFVSQDHYLLLTRHGILLLSVPNKFNTPPLLSMNLLAFSACPALLESTKLSWGQEQQQLQGKGHQLNHQCSHLKFKNFL